MAKRRAEVRELAAHHLAEVRAKIAELRTKARVLSDAARRCDASEAAFPRALRVRYRKES